MTVVKKRKFYVTLLCGVMAVAAFFGGKSYENIKKSRKI